MKRRVISFLTVLALCLSLCPIRALAAIEEPTEYFVNADSTFYTTHIVKTSQVFNTQGHSYTVDGPTAVSVQNSASLYLTTGTIKSTGGAGIEVQSECSLFVPKPNMTVIGETYGLDILPGATAQLSGGTFIGEDAAIWTEDDDYAALLAPGCAYFDENDDPLQPDDVSGLHTVKVKECTDHSYICEPDADTPTHSGTCKYCGTEVIGVPCTFNNFDDNGQAICKDCIRAIKITITPEGNSFVYDGYDKPDSVSVNVVLDGNENNPLTKDTDYNYSVEPQSCVDVGEFIVTVTGLTFNGTFTKTYSVTQAQPVITWNTDTKAAPVDVDYDGHPVDKDVDLPPVIITAPKYEDLEDLLYFSYREIASDADFTKGLPTDAGTYEIKANLPVTKNYLAASSDPITLKINKICPFPSINDDVPKAIEDLVYNEDAQELVTHGTVRDGAVILFATSQNGAYSESIPTGTNAGTYEVWYKVEESKNYNEVVAENPIEVTIVPKEITPIVELESYSYLYDGGEIRPDVTVMEPGTRKVLPDTEYTVEYSNNINVGGPKDEDSTETATDGEQSPVPTVTVKDKDGGNYSILPTSAYFTITAADQAGLTITNLPGAVSYGDVFTLGTFGGSGNGTVTWEIIDPASSENNDGESVTEIAKINKKSGKVTVTGVGTVTVQATKSGTDNDGNHKDATATWTFTADPRRVTATVTAENKTYDGKDSATVTAVVEQGVVSGDTIMITDLSGTFKDKNAGTNKIVDVDTENAAITVNGKVITNDPDAGEKYFVTIPGTTTADIYKAAATVTPPTPEELTYTGSKQSLITKAAVTPATDGAETIQVEYALSKDGAYSENIPEATNAGTYQIWYRVKESTNYLGTTAAMVEVTIAPKTVSSPDITLTLNSYEYDGSEKRPAVMVKDGETLIPSSEYTVSYSNNVNAGTNAAVTVTDNAGGNYTVNGSKTFEITKATAKFTLEPTAKQNLTYNGTAQALVSAGVPDGGTAVYSLNAGEYSPEIPTATERDTYTVHAKVLGDANHESSDPIEIKDVKIAPKSVNNPTVTCSPITFPYDGTEKTPNIIVTDDEGKEIPASEYTMTFNPQPRIEVGAYTVTVTAKSDGNYEFTTANNAVTGSFEIVLADQAPLSIVTDKAPTVCYGDTFELSTVGGSGSGAVKWSVKSTPEGIADITESGGVVTVKGVGSFTVTAYKEGTDGNYDKSNEDSITFTASPKPITLSVTAADKDYDGTTEAKVTAAWNNDDFVSWDGTSDKIEFTVTGTFDNPTVGANKQVRITATFDAQVNTNLENYKITYPATLTASIYQVDAKLATLPDLAQTPHTYTGEPYPLAVKSSTDGDIGTVEYSLSEKGVYTTGIPEVSDVGTYTVWYRVADSVNWKGISPVCLGTVTIVQKEVSVTASCTLNNGELVVTVKDGESKVISPNEYTVTVSPDNWRELNSFTVTVTAKPGGNYKFKPLSLVVAVASTETPVGGNNSNTGNDDTGNPPAPAEPGTESASTQTTVRDGTASTVVSAAAGNQLVNEAVASGSGNVVIKPEITGDVTKAEVSIPASAVGRIGNETDAALTVSTPIADVTIPNRALNALSNAGGTVSVAAEQVENTVVLTLTANGKGVESIPGGLTLTVPVEDAGPGTVAVLVCEDGTRVTVRKSVAGDGGVRIPLNGSATVEIVDNSKEFTDVPAESWAADAVAFASAHEMFNGTGEATFSPERDMSRAMLATVLYNLEGQPDQSVTGAFSDISSSSWYAESVSWAAENGIVTGYGNGSFGANDSVTREQLAVMLWRYAGSPTVDEQTLGFTDADQASGYAMEALCWAAANGILNGYGNGRIDPTGLATRAQAAQMMKNFIENT